MDFVSWDDDVPNIWKNNQNVPTINQLCDAVCDCVLTKAYQSGLLLTLSWNLSLGQLIS